jgi:hypothetical protein
VTGVPTHGGCTTIDPGQTCEFWIEVVTPECGSLQADDCWGPGDINECSFVSGDSFKGSKACDDCKTEWVTTEETEWGEWSSCKEEHQVQPMHVHRRGTCYQYREGATITTRTEKCAGETETIIGDIVETKGCDCECIETGPSTECGEWNECHEHPLGGYNHGVGSLSGDSQCYQEKQCLDVYVCKDDVEREEARPCECECIEEGPYEGEAVWGGETLKGSCPETFTASHGGERCHELGERTITWDCKDPTTEPLCRPAECPDDCVIPDEGTTLSWSGKGDPDTECEAFGPYEATWSNPDFYICKAGNDRIVEYSPPGAKCDNGKDRSHTTKCRCEEDD